MKKSLILLVVIVTIAAIMVMGGCRAANRVPGVSAVASVVPTLPMVSPSPLATVAQTTVGALTSPAAATATATAAP